MRFENRVVVVTGGAKGIGAGCAHVFAQEGGRVAILDIDETSGDELAKQISTETVGDATFIHCDVSQAAELQKAIDIVAEQWGQVDCLVNNAGIHPPATRLEETSPEELRRVLSVNFESTFLACQAALPHLRKTRGTIINMSSMTAVLGQTYSTAYAASKGAQLSFTKALALEVGEDGIRVNAVLPSNVDTPLMREWANTLDDPESALKRIADLQVFKRMATIQEIGKVVLFLATEDSSFVTGQGIEVEGGASLDY